MQYRTCPIGEEGEERGDTSKILVKKDLGQEGTVQCGAGRRSLDGVYVGGGGTPRVEPGERTVLNAERRNGPLRQPGLIRDILTSRARV